MCVKDGEGKDAKRTGIYSLTTLRALFYCKSCVELFALSFKLTKF